MPVLVCNLLVCTSAAWAPVILLAQLEQEGWPRFFGDFFGGGEVEGELE